MRLIDADALLAEAMADGAYGYVDAKQIADAPTVDTVPVVRCGECKHWTKSSFFKGKQGQILGQCDCNSLMRDADFFCKSGVKNKSARSNLVEVVRCKDCKWLVTKEKTGFHLCGLEKFETMRDLTDFCSMGERKDDDLS